MRSRIGGGFTLVEVLVVIGVIAILLTLLMPALSLAKERVRAIQCLNNQRQCGVAFFGYAADSDGYAVLGDGWDTYSGAVTSDRRWQDILMGLGYFNDVRTSISYFNGGCISSQYPMGRDIFSCPAIPPPPSGVGAPSNGNTTSYLGYGIRYFKQDFFRYKGERFSPGYNLPRLDSLWRNAPLMADALKILDGGGAPYTPPRQYNAGLRWAGDAGSATWGTQAFLAHRNTCNVLFSDGSASGLSRADFAKIPQPYDYGNSVSSDSWFVRPYLSVK